MPAFLLPLLLNLAPSVASWILGDKTGKAVEKVTGIVKQVTGLEGGDAIDSALAQRPELALQLKEALIRAESEERERQHQEVLAQLADMQSARSQTVQLAQARSPLAWGAAIVSVLSVSVFVLAVYLIFTKQLPAEMKDAAMLLIGAVIGGFNAVQNYWLGSSAGSASKDVTLQRVVKP